MVSFGLAGACRERRYQVAFRGKFNDCEPEAVETRTWLKFAVKCKYLDVKLGREIYVAYNQVLGGLVSTIVVFLFG
ncbi:four helix bundle protein [Dendronalium sp. ChiSLP03b]|uniref:four helix bundle protein n=1 Tax=Dendronalium sp. ChiSLP03b TaxID=3075381 RepID=UPI00391C93A0